MSVSVMTEVWELDLPANKKLLLLALADHADDDGGSIFPSVARMAWKCGWSKRQTQRLLKDLEAAGLIEAVAYPKGGRGKATEYRIHTAKGDRLAPFKKAPKGDTHDAKGRHSEHKRVTSATQKGDASVTPIIIESSLESSGNGADAPASLHQSHFDALMDMFGAPASADLRGIYASAASKASEMGWGREEMTRALQVWASQETDPKWRRNPGMFLRHMPTLLSPMSLVDSAKVEQARRFADWKEGL